MKFDEAVRHIQDGTATEEEKEYVHQKILEADGGAERENSPRIIESPKPVKIKGQKKEPKKFFNLVACIVAAVLALGAILAGVFGSAAVSAGKKDVLGRENAEIAAKRFAMELARDDNVYGLPLVTSEDDFLVEDIDRAFRYDPNNINESYYVYDVRLVAVGLEINVIVDSRADKDDDLVDYCRIKEVDKN